MIISAKIAKEIANRDEDNMTIDEEILLMQEILQEAKLCENEVCYQWKYRTSDKEAIALNLIAKGYEVQYADDAEIAIKW
jgi:hypothetical protein